MWRCNFCLLAVFVYWIFIVGIIFLFLRYKIVNK